MSVDLAKFEQLQITHTAIEIARRAGLPLTICGIVQDERYFRDRPYYRNRADCRKVAVDRPDGSRGRILPSRRRWHTVLRHRPPDRWSAANR
jgi:hypothetical protein